MANALEMMLYDNKELFDKHTNNKSIRFDKGMFISYNNHKQGSDTLYQSLKHQYKSIVYALTGVNISKSSIRLGKVPKRQKVMDIIANKGIILVAVIHQYDRHNNLTFRGSNSNYDTQHLHLFVYGVSHYLPVDDAGIDNKVRHIKHCLFRHNKFSKYAKDNKIDIREVGKGKYLYNDAISPTTFYDYLQLPKLHPSKDCLINYMAGCRENPTAANPLMFIYKEQD